MINSVLKIIGILLVLLVSQSSCHNKSKRKSEVTLLDFNELETKKLLFQSDTAASKEYDELIGKANEVLKLKPYSVMNKKGVPPSGDKHDYMSIGPYWWPNPKTKSKLPYIRKDGEINPETRNDYTDFIEMEAFLNSIKTLRKAYFFSQNKKYASKALELINVWFIDEATRMNPNINYGQSVPGVIGGRKFAIIEFLGVIEVLKCMEGLNRDDLVDHKTEIEFDKWLTDYVLWLQNSENGKGEANTKNNHGTHYDMQLLSILTYLNRIGEVKSHLETITKKRVFTQIEPDGSMPRELARTKSFSYTAMNLHGFFKLAQLGEKVGVDLWNAESADGRSIKQAFKYVLPYLTQEKKWEYKQIENVDSPVKNLMSDLKYAQQVFKYRGFDEVLNEIEGKDVEIVFAGE